MSLLISTALLVIASATLVVAASPGPSCPSFATLVSSPTTQTISGTALTLADRANWASGPRVLSQSGQDSDTDKTQYLRTFSLTTTGTVTVSTTQWPYQTQGQSNVVASVVMPSDKSTETHVYWPGQYYGTSIKGNTRIDMIKMNTDATINTWSSNVVASGVRVLLAQAATCGPKGNENDLSIRAFGSSFGTDVMPSSTASYNTAVDWYSLSANSLSWKNITTIPGDTPILRQDVTAVSAGTLCIFAGGKRFTGGHVNEISVLNVTAGAATMNWLPKWYQTENRHLMGSAYMPNAPGGSKVVFAGGLREDPLGTGLEIASNTVEIFDVNTGIPTTACLSVSRYMVSAAVIADRYVAFAGGFTAAGAASSVVELYDTLTKSWVVLSGMLTQARGNIALGSLNHPSYSVSENAFILVAAQGIPSSGGSSSVLDKITTLFGTATGTLPAPRYGAGADSWAVTNTNTANSFDGQMILAGGVTTGGTVMNTVLTIAPTQDPTNSANWASTTFSSSTPNQRQHPHAHILLLNGTSAQVGLVWGGEDIYNDAFTRYDTATYTSPPTWTGYNPTPTYYIKYDGAATCYAGTYVAPGDSYAVRGFGYSPSSSGAVQSGIVHHNNAQSLISWNTIGGGTPRWFVTGLGAGQYCMFAGGYDSSGPYNLVSVYNARIPGPTTTPYGVGMSAVTLSVARFRMASAFLPSANEAGVTGQNGFAIFAGGQLASGVSDVVDIIGTATLAWTVSSLHLTVARRNAQGIAIGTRYAVFVGGVNSAGSVVATVDLFDITTWSIKAISPVSVARTEHSIGALLIGITSQIYRVVIAGGADSSGTPLNTVDVITIPFAGTPC